MTDETGKDMQKQFEQMCTDLANKILKMEFENKRGLVGIFEAEFKDGRNIKIEISGGSDETKS